VSPEDENFVYIPGQRTLASTDGGQTFSQLAGTLVHLLPHGSKVLHLDAHALWIDPENPDHIWLGNDGGFHVSWDRGKSWLHYNNIPVSETYALSYDSEKPYNIYAGTQDDAAVFGPSNFILKDGEPEIWKHVFLDPWGGGDAFYTVRDPSNPDFVYFEQQMGELQRKNMRTGEVQGIKPRVGKDEAPLRFNWMSPYVISHFDPKAIYFGANQVFKSDNSGASWVKISPDLAVVPDASGKLQNGTITTISESHLKQGMVYVGNDRGTVHITMDDGKTWKQVGEGFPRIGVSRVLASAFDPGTAYVSLTGFRNDHTSPYLFRTKDFGATWTSIVGNLPAEAIYVVIEDPRDSRTLYVGTDLGVYVTTNDGESWQSLCNGLPALRIFDLFLHPGTFELVAGTHGRGVYILDAKSIRRL
ncbi:MAG: glycosyl hydrolase, partial [Armatimonadota bacterium]